MNERVSSSSEANAGKTDRTVQLFPRNLLYGQHVFLGVNHVRLTLVYRALLVSFSLGQAWTAFGFVARDVANSNLQGVMLVLSRRRSRVIDRNCRGSVSHFPFKTLDH